MDILLVAGAWLLLGVTFCLVTGRGIAMSRAGQPEPSESAPTASAPREFTSLAVHEWALAAHDIAIDELLATRPGAIRRVAAK